MRLTYELRAFLIAVLTFSLAFAPMRAYAGSSEIFDVGADAAPPYLDIVHAKVTDQVGSGKLVFLMELAAAVPNPPIDDFVAYNWQLDADPAFGGADFVIVVRWVHGQWQTYLSDERPTWSGGDPIQIAIEGVKFAGATQHVTLDPALIGNPTSFRWRALTRLMPSPAPVIDRAPDNGAWVTFDR